MICPRCKKPMREERGIHHKQRKWVCPNCGKVRMQMITPRRDKKLER
jgi:transposase-like protein